MIPFAGLLLQVEQKKVRGKAHQVCINPVSDAIVSDEWQEPPDERRREQYGDYFAIRAKLELLVNESRVVTANLVTLTTAALWHRRERLSPVCALTCPRCVDRSPLSRTSQWL